MCGIAGLMTTNGQAPDPAALAVLLNALRHRGPDGEGRYQRNDVAMAQSRLAIIDLKTGDQPLHGPEGVALVANGEIYNYVELRQEIGEGKFATHSDCEPPLMLYGKGRSHFTDRLRGMYAIALHDAVAGTLTLARDPFGIKPLYWTSTPKGAAFASEPQALLAAGLAEPRILPHVRDELLQLQFTTGRETIFAGIERVLPGETLVLRQGRVVERHRRPALPIEAPADWGEAEALARLDAALLDSVTVHQRSDVGYGMFLSGGIDSAALLAVMTRLNSRPVLAYTIGFPGSAGRDERELARALAQSTGAQHVEVEFSESDFWELLPQIAADTDDPCADYAIGPTWKLAREAAKDIKVVLTGEGGDEIFAGYGRFRSAVRPWWRGGRAMRPRGIMDGLGVFRARPAGWRDGIVAAESIHSLPSRTRLQVAQAVDCEDWLPNDLLVKLDRCLMAHGLEGRTPFLDPAVAGVGFALNDSLKIRNGLGKHLLRVWLEKNMPQAMPFSRKRGFTVPVGEWIGRHGKKLGALVASQPGILEVCNPQAVIKLFSAGNKRQAMAAWVLLYYSLWHRYHVLRRAPQGDVFSSLAASREGGLVKMAS
jgi:asparagine synthase (glutamine-hydrolysing)